MRSEGITTAVMGSQMIAGPGILLPCFNVDISYTLSRSQALTEHRIQ